MNLEGGICEMPQNFFAIRFHCLYYSLYCSAFSHQARERFGLRSYAQSLVGHVDGGPFVEVDIIGRDACIIRRAFHEGTWTSRDLRPVSVGLMRSGEIDD